MNGKVACHRGARFAFDALCMSHNRLVRRSTETAVTSQVHCIESAFQFE